MKHLYWLLLIFSTFTTIGKRNPHRPLDQSAPVLTVYYQGDHNKKHLYDEHLHKILFTTYDQDYFSSHLLPQGGIVFRNNPEHGVDTATLDRLAHEALQELQDGKKKLTHFTILKKRDTNKQTRTGIFVLKYNDFPFVLKLFIESPESFTHPTSKGFEPSVFHVLSGGTNRHTAGFTRIKNLETIKELTLQDPYWSSLLDFPRKWFWLPQQPTWLVLEGKNIGPETTISTTIPAIYGIICDEIVWEHEFSHMNLEESSTAVAFSNFVEQRIDSHIVNYGIEQQTGKLVPIDFEHFPTFVGSFEKPYFQSHVQCYTQLALRFLKNRYGTLKGTRRIQQQQDYALLHGI